MIATDLASLVERHDAFLIDQFGVLLNGVGAYPGAPEALARLAQTGKPAVLLSNSGKRSLANAKRLEALGFRRDSFIDVVSSGEAAYAEIGRRIGASIAPGTAVWLHAREDDLTAIAGLDLVAVDRPEQAGLLLLAGSRGDVLSLKDYARMLGPAARQGIPCMCSNPDLEMLTPSGKRIGAGRIAELYIELGGTVEWIGKPHPLIYHEALRHLPGVAAARILCIGDSPAHDIVGGRRAGLATALVRTGLHEALSDAELTAMCLAEHGVPDFMIPRFAF